MSQRQYPFRNIKVVVRPGAKKLKIVLILLILASVVALAALGFVRAHIESQTQAALDRAAELEQENAELIDKIDSLGSSSSIEKIAKEELGLVRPDTVIINPNSQ